MRTLELDLTLEMIERTRQRLLGHSLGYQEALDLMLAIRRLGEDVLHCVNRNQAKLRSYSDFHESWKPPVYGTELVIGVDPAVPGSDRTVTVEQLPDGSYHVSDEPRQLAVSDTAASGARPDPAEPSGQRSGT